MKKYNDRFKPKRFGDKENQKYNRKIFSPNITRIIDMAEKMLLNKLR